MGSSVSFNRLHLDDDARLRDLVVESAHNLEPELRVVGGRLPIGGSRTLDLVGVDSETRLALIEVRCRETPEWVLEAIDHYDWAREHAEEIARLYAQHPLDIGRLPRLILVTSTFSTEFLRRIVYFQPVPLELAEFRYLEVNGVRGLYFETVQAGAGTGPPCPSSLQDHLDLMTDSDRAAVAERLVARVAALDPSVRLLIHRAGALALWEDRLLARLDFNRSGVWVSDEVTGGGTEVRRLSDLEPAVSGLAARVAHWRRLARVVPAMRRFARGTVHAEPALRDEASGGSTPGSRESSLASSAAHEPSSLGRSPLRDFPEASTPASAAPRLRASRSGVSASLRQGSEG